MRPASAFFAIASMLLLPLAGAQTTVPLSGRSIAKLLPDYLRPRVYALNRANGSVPGTLLALNSTNGAIENEISVSLNPTDMAITPAGDVLYVINGGSRTISKVDLTTFTVIAEKAISTPNTYNSANPLYVVASQSGTVYYTDGAWGPEIYAMDYNSGTNLLVLDTGGNQSIGAGGLVLNRTGNILYIWQQYGWSAGLAVSAIASMAVGTNSLTTIATGSLQGRDPLDTPIFLDSSERWVFNKQQKVSATNVTVLATQFTDNIYAISLDGSVAFGPTEVFNAETGIVITNLPFSTTVQTLSGDQARFFRYNGANSSVVIYDMANIVSISGLEILPVPADGSVVALPPTNLVWSPSPTALAYDVYFGTNQSAVASATAMSPLYLGRVTIPGISPGQTLLPGHTYYWRVDTAGFNATNTGPAWSFTVSPIAIAPAQISVGGIAGYNPASISLSVTSASPTAWAAAVTGAPWLTISPPNGTTPGTITLGFNTAALGAGSYSNNIEFTFNTVKVEVPVRLDIAQLNIVKMAADLQRPYIYALQPPPLSGQSGQLLFINSQTGNIDKALPIGLNPVDLAIHYGEDRLYIASWTENATYVVDLASQTLLPPLHLGTDVYKINAGKPGRIVIEGEDQWVGVSIVDTATGQVIGSMPWPEREGDGEMDPTGTYYYHCDNNISNAHIHKEQIVNDVATEVAGSNEHPYGSRTLVLSPDGSTLFWQGFVYDANLNELGSLGEQIYTTTAHGDLALGGQHVFNSRNGALLYTWPFSTSVMAVSGDQQDVFLFNGTAKQLVTIPMSSIATVPGPGLNPTPPDQAVINLPLAQLSWTLSPFALSYRLFLGTNQTDVNLADTNSAVYLGTTSSNKFALAGQVVAGLTYYWRVDTVGFSAVTPGPVWSFTASGLSVFPQNLAVKGVAGLPILPQNLSLTAPLATSWNLAIAQPWLAASATAGTTPSSITLNFGTTNLAAGIYTNQLTFSANGVTLRVPLVVQLIVLNASKMVADRNRDAIYILHPGSGTFDDAFLLFLNTDSGVVEQVIPIGINPTDLSINSAEDRLYVSNWQHNQTRIVDLASRAELPQLALGTDIYKLNGGRAGRLVVEGEDQWVGLTLINTADGSVLASGMVREGDGECDPTGRFYYHGDNNISGAGISKFDLNADTFASVTGAGGHYYFGSRNIVMSLDGSRLFWTSAMYDANLADFGSLGDEIYACSTNGAVAFGATQAYDSAAKRAIYPLPVSTSVSAVDRKNQWFWYFDNSGARLRSIPMLLIQSPQITQQPAASTSVILGNALYLTVTAQGLAPLSYQWMQGGSNLTGQTNYFLSVPAVNIDQQGDYRVVVSNPFNSVTSTVAHVTILTPPVVLSQSANTNVLAGQAFTLSATAGGTPPFNYSWLFENVPMGVSGSTLTIADAQSSNEGGYRVVIVNNYGTVTGAVISVHVLASAPVIVGDPTSVSVYASSNATLSVTARGSEPLAYQWLFNGAPIGGATSSLFSLSNVQAINSGQYQAVVTNSFGSVTSAVAALSVIPRAPYFVLQPRGTVIPAGSNATFSAQANGSQPIAYQWQHNGNRLSSATLSTLALTNLAVADSGAYTLVASNIAGVSTSAVAQLTVYLTPSLVQALGDLVLDVNSTAVLTVSAQGSPAPSYSWHLNGSPIPGSGPTLILSNMQPTQSGYYSVTATNQYGNVSSTARVSVLGAPSEVVAWGDNSSGQTNVPPGLKDIVAVAGGDFHSVALRHDGSLAAWGQNTYGQTVVPTNLLRFVSLAAGADHSLAITEHGSVVGWGRNSSGQCNIPSGATSNVLALAAGDSYSLALLASGSVLAWGDNSLGQTSVPPGLNNVRAIAAGRNHSLALRANGTVVGWGDNSYGDATPPALTNAIAIAAGLLHSVALLSNGTVVVWGDKTFRQADVPAGLTNVVAIAAGDFHTLALRADGSIVGWGDDRYGQTTISPDLVGVSALTCGYYHNLVLRPARTPLEISRVSSGLVIHWTGGATLQWAPTPLGPFTDLLVEGNAYTNSDMSAPAKFFRLSPLP